MSSKFAATMAGQAVSYASVVHVAKVLPGETVLISGASGGLGSVCGIEDIGRALGDLQQRKGFGKIVIWVT